MKLLAIETTSAACSCALYVDGSIRERGSLVPRGHAERVLAMVSGLLDEAGLSLAALDGLAFGRGPGSFTGSRIGTGVVQGLAFGADLPVAPISSLQALAQGVYRELARAKVLVALDARMREVYWGSYVLARDRLMALAGAECVCPPAAVPAPDGDSWCAAGDGWRSYPDALGGTLQRHCSSSAADRHPHARDVAVLGVQAFARGDMVAADMALPVYLRDQVTKISSDPLKSGNPRSVL